MVFTCFIINLNMTDVIKTEKDIPDISSGSDHDFRIRPLSEMSLPDQKAIKQIGILIFASYAALAVAMGFTLNSSYGSRYKLDSAYATGERGHDEEAQVCRDVNNAVFMTINDESVADSEKVGSETVVGCERVEPADAELGGFVAPETDFDAEVAE